MHRPYYLGTSTILNIASIKIIALSLIALLKFEVFMNHIPQCYHTAAKNLLLTMKMMKLCPFLPLEGQNNC